MIQPSPVKTFDLVRLSADPDQLAWQPYREGIEIYRLYGDGVTGPTAAFLRYRPGAAVPRHEHVGYEHIFVLSGSQRDESDIYSAGSLVINRPGTRHRVWSEAGCIVLVIYEQPVRFLESE